MGSEAKILAMTKISFKERTPFQQKVYEVAGRIPFGQTRSYKWVAKEAGSPEAVRAAGQALKRNPFPLVIPCHRVVKSDGSVGGYIWGSKVKEGLLTLEKS